MEYDRDVDAVALAVVELLDVAEAVMVPFDTFGCGMPVIVI